MSPRRQNPLSSRYSEWNDQLYPLQLLAEKAGYGAYFFHKVEGGNAIATWLVRVPATLLKHEEKVIPRMGLRATDTTVEDEVLYAPTCFDGGGILGAFVIGVLVWGLISLFTYTILDETR